MVTVLGHDEQVPLRGQLFRPDAPSLFCHHHPCFALLTSILLSGRSVMSRFRLEEGLPVVIAFPRRC